MLRFRKEKPAGNSVEFRYDPLTGWQTRINPQRAGRPRQGQGAGDPEGLALASQQECPFCPERLKEATPTFPKNLLPEGRLYRGETVIFPNLHPFASYGAVSVMGRSHWLPLDAFSPGLLIDNLLAAQDYFLRVFALDPSAPYPVYVMNYMPPSAGSIVHPHGQLWLEREPLPRLGQLLERSRRYFRGATSYWEALVERERQEKERFIGENEAVAVMTSFAPRGSREVLFVFKRPCPLPGLEGREIDHFCQALSAVLRGYHAIGVGSFNLASFSSAVGETLPYFPVQFRLISRPYPRGIYTNDTGPLERFFGVSVVDDLPEEVAASLRPHFSGTYQRDAS